jgi:DNA-binding beta-propeller fold protein YncE
VLGSSTDGRVAAAPTKPMKRPGSRRLLVAHPRLWLGVASVLVVLVAAVGVQRLTAPPAPVIKSIAGVRSLNPLPGGGYSGDGSYANQAALSWPSDLAVGADGSIYIADFGNLAVRKISDGIITTIAGRGPKPLARNELATQVSIGYASNLAVDATGDVYILTDVAGDLEVWVIAPDSFMSFKVSLGHSDQRNLQRYWNTPVGGLALAKDGTLFIADRAANRVWKLGPGETEPTLIAGTGEAGFSGDLGAATSAQLDWPTGLALGRNGDLYIADTQNDRIRKVDGLRGTITTVVGPERLKIPFGVAYRPDGSLYVADSGHNRVLEILPSRDVVTVAGTGTDGYNGDGIAGAAHLSGPESVAFEGNGRLLIADSGNHRVREVTGLP